MTAPPPPQPAWQRPSPRLLRLWRVALLGGLAVAALAGLAVAAVYAGVPGAVAVLVIAGVLAGFGWWLTGRRYAAWGYAERGEDLLVRRGLLLRRLSVVPYGRMQFVDVLAGPIDRKLGLAAVHLHTAAAATDAHIPGLPAAEADRLRDRLAALGEARAAGL